MKQQQHLFTNKMLRALLVPIIMEQLLNALMGTVDTMMVSNVGWQTNQPGRHFLL